MPKPSGRRVWIWVFVWCCALVVLLGIVIPAIPPNERNESEGLFCEKCGVRKWTMRTTNLSTGAVVDDRSELGRTALSTWHAAHYPSPCAHVWQTNDVGSQGYFVLGPLRMRAGVGISSSRRTPRLLSLDETDRRKLDEEYAADKAACQSHITAALKHLETRPPETPR